ncbi:hypothetical protein Tco_1074931, partial [Tanacetum coccineum]
MKNWRRSFGANRLLNESEDEAAASLTKFELKKILQDKIQKSKSIKMKTSSGSDIGLEEEERRAMREPPKGFKSKRCLLSRTLQRLRVIAEIIWKSVQAEEQGLLNGKAPAYLVDELIEHFLATSQSYARNNSRLIDLTKRDSAYFDEAQGLQVVPANYFFNNDREYLKGASSSGKYTTSTTKAKATKSDNIEGIEDMVSTLWSPVKVAYDKYDMWDMAHLGPKQQKFYGYAS